ncbi:uncharacterized membrane protein YebE (DUF533 family) [Nocardia transvalensis]|uniref:Uncharacterized membrane protein YebE (DUF533 family) n=1 Tax=Nocardia transvalensis TaxID=37333 RepID=A0A7W9P851_9NOCA|nr:hypothetical protein [Nocardia transvalensis]MBB5911261.1 uncharacterized membrane protein YebE (DUF533 family) [Nocardia transvalensis]
MDPISIGTAAAVLLGTRLGEEFAKNAGASAWEAALRLRALALAKFRDNQPGRAAIETLTEAPSEENVTIVAEFVDEAARVDPTFAHEVRQLVEEARGRTQLGTFRPQAFDQAKQVNVVGDNHGPVTLS